MERADAVTRLADGDRRIARALAACGGTIALAMLALSFVDARYVWDGRLQRLGEDPYRVVPDDPAVAHLHTPVTRQLNNGWVPTIYPPGAELFFRAVTAVEESARAMKGTLVLCDGLVVLVVLRLLAAGGLSPWWVLAYAWNPLVALEGAGNGHVDVLGTLAVATTAWAVVRKRRTVAALAFAFAVGVKPLPIVLAPLLWRQIRVRDALAGLALLAALYLPFMHEGVVPLGSLRAYLAEWRFNAPLFAALAPHASATTLACVAALAGLAVAAWARTRLPDAAWAWPVAVTLALAPSIYPWYLLWLTPFLFAPLTRPLAVWTVAILPTYVALHLEDVHGTWGVPGWLVTAEYGAVVVAMAVTFRARRLQEPAARLAPALAGPDG